MANPNIGELFKDRRVVIGTAVAGVAVAAGAAILLLPGLLGGGGGEQAAAPSDAAPVAAPAANPGAPTAAVSTPATAGAPVKPTQAVASGPPKAASSFDNPPKNYAFAGGGAAGAPAAAAPTGSAPTGGTDTAAAKIPLAPIRPNVKAAGFRADPFVSYRFLPFAKPSAFNFVAPIRIASRPQPKVKPPSGNPEVDFGPLPFVPRRVAGVLYNGEVSAILETGTPGQDTTNVQIIQPGMAVPSGIPGIADLTVATISPTQVVLRADDGRTVTVPLTAVPDAYQSAFRSSLGGSTPGGVPGAPPSGPTGRSGAAVGAD